MIRAHKVCGWVLIVLAIVLGIITIPVPPRTAISVAAVQPDRPTTSAAETEWTYSGQAIAGCLGILAVGVILVAKAHRPPPGTPAPHEPPGPSVRGAVP